MLSSAVKQSIHCYVVCFIISNAIERFKQEQQPQPDEINPWLEYGVVITAIVLFSRSTVLFVLPRAIFNVLGLSLYNSFPEKVTLKGNPSKASFICFRVVTRGNYPELVRCTLEKNLSTCLKVGLEHFFFEVVTNKSVELPKHERTRELVVPEDYVTKKRTLFKARNLQYCLEDNVNTLKAGDWIVHLDEDTVLTDGSVRGIIKFVTNGKHQCGQGVITYADTEVVNWKTTIADSLNVLNDLGQMRFLVKTFHKPLNGWKGTFMVIKVSFDHDIERIIANFLFVLRFGS